MVRIRRDARALELERLTTRYEVQNKRFEIWLDERDRRARERTVQRLANVSGRGEHGSGSRDV